MERNNSICNGNAENITRGITICLLLSFMILSAVIIIIQGTVIGKHLDTDTEEADNGSNSDLATSLTNDINGMVKNIIGNVGKHISSSLCNSSLYSGTSENILSTSNGEGSQIISMQSGGGNSLISSSNVDRGSNQSLASSSIISGDRSVVSEGEVNSSHTKSVDCKHS